LSRLFNPPHDQASPLANGAFDDLRIVDQVEELIVWVSSNKLMSSEEYYASEFSDDYLDAQADAGDYFLDESGFYFRLNSVEVSELVREGGLLLLCDKLLGKDTARRSRESIQTEQRRPNSPILPRLRGFEVLR
jgi:hypothetical protein